jgi:short-subunit dehydrogenase
MDAYAVVTGASSGIGRELACGLARRGHALMLVARRERRLEELAAELRERHGVPVEVWPCDLADFEQRTRLGAELRSRRVSVLCSNAGFATFGPLAEADATREAALLAVNVTALHELTLAVLPGMVERNAGAIVISGSVAGEQPIPSAATYSATKAFANTFGQALSIELLGTNVTCTVLCSGPVRTEFFAVAGVGKMESVSGWMGWQDPARIANATLAAMERGHRLVTPGTISKVQALAGRHTPRALLLRVLGASAPRIVRRSA